MPGSHRSIKVLLVILVVCAVGFAVVFAIIPRITKGAGLDIIVKSGTSLTGIARELKDQRIIWSSTVFVALSLLRGGKLKAGEYSLSPTMSTLRIIGKMARGERNIYTLLIREGENMYDISESLDKARIMPRDEFLSLAKGKAFIDGLGIRSDSLEGYLYPDTYYYSRETGPDLFIGKIAGRTLAFFEREDVKKRMGELAFDVNKVLTLASMIEREAKVKQEKPIISAVFHNRLRKGMSLDCDPTVTYGTGRFNLPIRKSDLTTPTPYNTYTFAGLPKGPIANPDRGSIEAALSPAQVDYLYFVSKNDGTHVFSKDMKDHNRYVMMYQRVSKKKTIK
jgi:UPF0755 protein